jgi:hypothetical protein
VVSCSDGNYSLKLSDESGMALVHLVPNAQLPILVITHAEDLSPCSKQQGVEDTALDLLDFMAEIDQ